MRPGDERDGLELLEINHRTVSLQRGRDRWEIALLDQPLVHHAAQARERPVPNARRSKQTRASTPDSSLRWQQPEPTREPPAFNMEMDSSQTQHLITPELPVLPELPVTPELPVLPGLPVWTGLPTVNDSPSPAYD